MRLLITTDTIGGVWSFTRDLSTELLNRGHAVALVSFGRAPSPGQQAWCAEQRDLHPERFDFTASEVALEWMQNNERVLTDGEPVLAAVAERFHPDLLLANQFCFGAFALALPRIVVAHSDVLSWAAAAKPSALDPTPWLNQYTSLVQRGLLQADVLVTPTQWMLAALKRNFLLSSATATIPNGCQLPTAESSLPRKLQAVSAGRLWDEAKGLEILAEGALPLPVLIAGDTAFDGAESPSASMPGVTMLGPLSTERLQALFQESAIYLCTSHYEPFGLAPVEAGMCGCAILARDLPSLREVWGSAAIFFRDPAEFNAILRKLAHDPATLAEAQRRSHNRAAQYTAARMADSYLTVFEHVLQHRRSMPHVA